MLLDWLLVDSPSGIGKVEDFPDRRVARKRAEGSAGLGDGEDVLRSEKGHHVD